MILVGEVLESEIRRPRAGSENQYDPYVQVKVLDRGAGEVFTCRVGDNYGPSPSKGEVIEAEVALRAYKRGSEAQLSVSLIRPAVQAALRAVNEG